ncbi:DUF4305 domain-containing protein [Alkalibacterium pelagium]|jgi:heme/copper-type cytochrome/quinol oxidase subunit 4|uniref:DUF4305 domain-containing protein n=1 Tax=Alkalibacterium pelagium TaxID=426702 RepID=A0A1H7EVG6_9LACT|nr:DUF4305 domain-containing protein [Alkalibacterium pelagium]GEN49642.1 hypothetical protein APE02nite_03070 [Alkalibacterium pelagium]SEK17614.1 protein of unknown function [Alkalibacterium pelagium]
MTEKQIMFQIAFKYIFFLLFMFFTIDSVGSSGWGFFSFLFALFATKDFVQGTRMAAAYLRIKKSKNNSK